MRVILLVVVVFLIGIAVGAFAVYRTMKASTANVQREEEVSQPAAAPDSEPVRVGRTSVVARPFVVPAATADPATIEEVKRMIPNFDSVSLEEGTRILREAALKEFKAAANEMQTRLSEAQQRLGQAQSGGSAAEQQAAMKDLQQVQADQTEKLKQIAARSAAQIEALRQLKATAK